MSTVRATLNSKSKLTKEQKNNLKKLKDRPVASYEYRDNLSDSYQAVSF